MLKWYRLLLFIAIVLLAVLSYAYKPAFVDTFALRIEDLKFKVRTALGMAPKPVKDIVIVTVDEKSVNKLGRWPWDRKIVGDILGKMNQATIMGLDIVFSEPTSEEDDQYLADIIADNENIVLGYFFRDKATEEVTEDDLDTLEDCSYYQFQILGDKVGLREYEFSELNVPVISDAGLTCAYFNTEPDADGLYRRYPVAYVHKGYIFPSMAIQMLRFYMNKEARIVLDDKGVKEFSLGDIRLNRQNYIKVNYYDLDESIYISAVDVYNGKILPEFFKNKIVMVGVTEIGVFDMRPTPLDPVTPGVLLHYAAISNFLNKEMLKSDPRADYLMIGLTLLLMFAVSYRRILWQRISMYIVALGTLFVLVNTMLITSNFWLREAYALFPAIFFILALEVVAFVYTELRAGELKRAFTSYVSAEVVNEILTDPDKLDLGGVEREITIMFSDIRGFTTLSEKVTAQQLVHMLTQLHDPMTNVVLQNKGMLDKYIGDAMMALFNTPLTVENHADMACKTALELVRTLHEVNRAVFEKEGFPTVDVGVGLNTGVCVVGNMGSKVRFEYTAIGDAVNLASRLEGLCKAYKTRVVISEFTHEKLTEPFLTRMLDRVRVKGKEIPVAIYEVMEDTPDNRKIKEQFDIALARYFEGDFKGAVQLFEELEQEMHDKTSGVFVERCTHYMEEPPEQPWDGVFTLKSK